ncbi:MAG: AraC family transcriptional regulator [Rhizonema sp. PD38]|nr:AraC family transcriptional regulator [Rhizonema sp. PD38]
MSEQRITAIGVKSGEPTLAVPNVPILSSERNAWDGIFVEQHRLRSAQIPELSVPKHLICIQLSSEVELNWRVAGEREQSRLLTADDISFTPAGLPRMVRWKQQVEVIFISLEPESITRAVHDSVYANDIEFAPKWGGRDPQIQYIGLALKAELETGSLNGRLYGEYLANALAVHLLHRYSVAMPTIQNFTGGLPMNKLRKVTEYINDNLDQDLSLDAIAATIGMSCYYFVRMFKQSTGLTPHQYVIERRLNRAKVLLTTTDLTILEISFRIGFKSQSHFTRLFRKLTGITPRAYRG